MKIGERMENVSLNDVYRHLLHIEERLNHLENVLQIPEVELPAKELRKHMAVLQKMKTGKEGTSWEECKKRKS